jgi:carbonic anhydrase
VQATVEELRQPKEKQSPNLQSIVNRIRPAVAELMAKDVDPATLIRHAVRANVRSAAHHLRSGSEILEPLIHQGSLLVIGAEYSLETGEVDFFDGV